ncbi:hypothetical protein KUV61_00785 [Nocardioides marinus]|nr:hypothetical protein [Nocardioides marinus]
MARILFDLLKACLNATLILLALCLFLGWKLLAATEGVSANAAEIAQQLQPLRDAVRNLQQDVAGLRNDIRTGDGPPPSARLARLEQQLSEVQDRLATIQTLPQQAAASAARAGASELAARLIAATPGLGTEETGCLPPGS